MKPPTEIPDLSCEIPMIASRLRGLAGLLLGIENAAVDRTSNDLTPRELSGLGLLLVDIAEQVEGLSVKLYGKDGAR
jgi:hypothetical protein